MNRVLVVLVLLVVGAVALGFYLDWFHLSTVRTDEKVNITVTVDEDKMKEDKERAKAKAEEFGHKVREKAGEFSDKVKKEGGRP